MRDLSDNSCIRLCLGFRDTFMNKRDDSYRKKCLEAKGVGGINKHCYLPYIEEMKLEKIV